MTDTEELKGRIDPEREYGWPGGYEGVLKSVDEGVLVLSEGHGVQPVIRERREGLRVLPSIRGSGTFKPGPSNLQINREWFIEKAEEDKDRAYAALMDLVEKGSVKAIQIFFEYALGKPTEQKTQQMTDLVELLLERATRPELSTTTHDVEVREIELEERLLE